jgi:hypothetical protein
MYTCFNRIQSYLFLTPDRHIILDLTDVCDPVARRIEGMRMHASSAEDAATVQHDREIPCGEIVLVCSGHLGDSLITDELNLDPD